jgi:hypothetical protein
MGRGGGRGCRIQGPQTQWRTGLVGNHARAQAPPSQCLHPTECLPPPHLPVGSKKSFLYHTSMSHSALILGDRTQGGLDTPRRMR